MKLLIYTILTYYLLILPASSTYTNINSTAYSTEPPSLFNSTSTPNTNTTKQDEDLLQNDAVRRQKDYNTKKGLPSNYKIAYNQGGAALTAFPVLSKIASIKRERSSVDYSRPLDIGQTSSGLTPQLKKLLQLPINKREATTTTTTTPTPKNKTEEKRETSNGSGGGNNNGGSKKIISAKHSNFGSSNAYKQGGYEGSPDIQASAVKNFLGTMTRTVGKGSSRNQFGGYGGYGSNYGSSQIYSGMGGIDGISSSWNSQQEQLFPSQNSNSNNNYGLGGFPLNTGQASYGISSGDAMGMNNNGKQGNGNGGFTSEMNSMNFGAASASSNINGMSGSGPDNYGSGTSNNMQTPNSWSIGNGGGGNDFTSSGINNNAGLASQNGGGSDFGMSQGTNNYGTNVEANGGVIIGMNGYTGGYVAPSPNNYGINTDYSSINTNNGYPNSNTNGNGFSNVNPQGVNNYGINTNEYSNLNSENSGNFGMNVASTTGDFINTNTFSSTAAVASTFPAAINNNNYENTGIGNSASGGIDYSNLNNNNNFGSTNSNNNNGGVDSFSSQTSSSTSNFGPSDNSGWTNNMNNNNNNNNAYTGKINYSSNNNNGMINAAGIGSTNTNFFGTNNIGGNGFSNSAIGSSTGSSTGNPYNNNGGGGMINSNSNFGLNGNNGFNNVNTIPSPVGGFNNINIPMTNTGLGTTSSGNGGTFTSNNGGGGNDGMSNIGSGINGGFGTDYSSSNNNNNAGGFESSGNEGDSMAGNEYNSNSMNYANTGSMGMNNNANVNVDYSSQMNVIGGGDQQQQQTNGFNANANIGIGGFPQTFENSQQNNIIGTAAAQINNQQPQNPYGFPSSSYGPVTQPIHQSYSSNNGQAVGGFINTIGLGEYGTPSPPIIGTQVYPGASNNYLNIANNIAQQNAYNNIGVHGSQFNSVPPQTYNQNSGTINYVSSYSNPASAIPNFGPNSPSFAGSRFSSYGTSTHSGHNSHAPTKSNIYTVVAPIPNTSSSSDSDPMNVVRNIPETQPPPPPTTYKHGSNVYTTTYTAGFDSSAASAPSSTNTFSGREKIGDVYSDKYGDIDAINIYQTRPKPKPLSEFAYS